MMASVDQLGNFNFFNFFIPKYSWEIRHK
jgi:hypothetical protein